MNQRYLLLMILTVLWGHTNTHAQEKGTGLECVGYDSLRVVIIFEDSTRTSGLSESRIETKVQLRLRQAGIRPVQENTEVLTIDVTVVADIFHVVLSFNRIVNYATTWTYGGCGSAGRNFEYVLQGLDQFMDVFLNDYLAANQP